MVLKVYVRVYIYVIWLDFAAEPTAGGRTVRTSLVVRVSGKVSRDKFASNKATRQVDAKLKLNIRVLCAVHKL